MNKLAMAASSESGAGTEALACSICRYDCQMGYVVAGAVWALGFGLRFMPLLVGLLSDVAAEPPETADRAIVHADTWHAP